MHGPALWFALLLLGCAPDPVAGPPSSHPAPARKATRPTATAPRAAEPTTDLPRAEAQPDAGAPEGGPEIPPAATPPVESAATPLAPSVAVGDVPARATPAATPPRATDGPNDAATAAPAEAGPDAAPTASAEQIDDSPPPPAPGPEPAAARSWALSAQKSRLLVRVYRDPDTMGAGLSHDHVILARSLSGSVTWHPTDPTACDIQVRLPVRQLDPDPPRLRARLGLEGTLSEKQRGQVKKHMLADDQLHGDAHSHITFTATSCAATEGAVVVNGKLTIRGETRSVQTILQVDLSDGFHAAGTLPIRATQFGFEPYTALMGALKNQDEMTLDIRLVGE